MKQGFIKVAAVTPDIRVADVEYNTQQICAALDEAAQERAKIVVFPELCVTGYTCGDLFLQDVLLQASKKAVRNIAEYTKEKDMLVFLGVPLQVEGKLYNTAARSITGKSWDLQPKHFFRIMQNFMKCVSLRRDRMSAEKLCLMARLLCLARRSVSGTVDGRSDRIGRNL